jgi:hypothetical protein
MASRRPLLRLAAIVVAAAALVPLAGVAPGAAVAPPPAGLPAHLGIGLSAHPDNTGIYGWMPNSGIPFDYAYQYLAGGANTGNGWAAWNTSGQFPLWYAQGAASHNYIPVFPYYQLLQSNGPCNGCGEAQRDLANLNAPATTGAYFSDFTLLMKRLGNKTWDNIAGFGKTAVVHVEPDLSGYAEQAVSNNGGACYGFCTGQGNDASLLRASVASSGVADVAAYANTYRGFTLALMHLRDVYAPNVLLAFHVSNWATLQDIGSSTDTSLDAAALGRQAGTFATSAGAGSYDLVFNDVADRDAGYYKYVYGSTNSFWDRQNVKLPNFVRWEQYLGAVTATVNRPAMVWQIPLGNQWFATENNTDGHYQDNRAEYFFSHMSELQQAGVIGLLFGAGNGGSTVNNDGKADGITNPASFCTADGVGTGQICNNHASTVSDDDGGYLRMAATNYYKAPLPIGGGGPPPPPPDTTPPPAPVVSSPQTNVTTRTTTFTVTGTAEAAALVRIWVDANNNGKRDTGEALAGSMQLGAGATSWTVTVQIAIGYNYFVATATDAAGNQSTATRVPRIRGR